MELDRDLRSIQQARDLVREAREAQAAFAAFTQHMVDEVVRAMAEAAEAAAEPLARMAAEETGFGVIADKVAKNRFASRAVYDSMKDKKTIGIVGGDPAQGLILCAVPMGVVCGIVPSTNPTSTAIFKALISVKAGNALVISPHPSALRSIGEAVRVLGEAARSAGAPKGLLGLMTVPTLGGTNELMKLSDLILATGGSAMVKAAYSSGTPALGVGAGNVPAFIERTADIPMAVRRIMDSKTFDNGTICASEQSIVTERPIKDEVIAEFKRQGGHFVSGEDQAKLERIILRAGSDTVNPRIVGRAAVEIAEMAGVRVPADTRVILCEQDAVGAQHPFSIEKLSPLLAFYVEDDWQNACKRCLELLRFAGVGHSLAIHTGSDRLVRTFLQTKPVSRLLVNTPAAQGAIGLTTQLVPSLTLGCGAVGGSATSDNVTVEHLYQLRRAAYGTAEAGAHAPQKATEADIEAIVAAVLRELRG
ncbi:MAG: acetaldehyde dehydrogenase (acetylating) [Eubacteriales bacterium]|nr:acetaldehyde dehydrogenase (acetylating) [Eubacteriales bacterium]